MKRDDTKRDQMLDFITGLYIPKDKVDNYDGLVKYLHADTMLNFRSPNSNDAFKSRYRCLIIEVKGDSKWRTFQNWAIKYVDFNHVGKTYAEAYIYDLDGVGYPCRIRIDSPKLAIIQ